tara:strand:+ start:11868 stop:12770 length:903 start_codon:yes stop_codon:yes gene_type:complete
MGHKKAVTTTKIYLENAPLPSHGKTYTVVSHKEVMDHTQKLLKVNGFKINNQLFKASMNARVAQGIYNISGVNSVSDNEISMMFAWTNSYDKSTRFQCGVGAYVMVCNNGMIHGDMANYGRKHTGTANADIAVSIAQQISVASQNFNQLVQDKNDMKTVNLSNKKQAEFLGRLFVEEKLLDSQQMTCVKNEMEKASYNYGVNSDCAWSFYNHVTHALKLTHPRNWMKNQAKFHEFMTAECLSNTKNNTKDTYTNSEDDIQMPEEHLIELPDGRIIDELDAARPENCDNEDYDSSNNVFTL